MCFFCAWFCVLNVDETLMVFSHAYDHIGFNTMKQ